VTQEAMLQAPQLVHKNIPTKNPVHEKRDLPSPQCLSKGSWLAEDIAAFMFFSGLSKSLYLELL